MITWTVVNTKVWQDSSPGSSTNQTDTSAEVSRCVCYSVYIFASCHLIYTDNKHAQTAECSANKRRFKRDYQSYWHRLANVIPGGRTGGRANERLTGGSDNQPTKGEMTTMVSKRARPTSHLRRARFVKIAQTFHTQHFQTEMSKYKCLMPVIIVLVILKRRDNVMVLSRYTFSSWTTGRLRKNTAFLTLILRVK